MLYDEFTINESQKKDQVFSLMLDEVRRGCPSWQSTWASIWALQDRVIKTSDEFEELLVAKQSPLSLFAMRQACQDFDIQMLCRLDAAVIDSMH